MGIMKKINSNSYQRVYEAIQELIKRRVLCSEKVGHTSLIRLNFSRETFVVFAFLDEQEGYKIPNYSKTIDIKETSDYILLVTGSYARGNANKKSDLDLVVIIPDKENVVTIQKLVENITMLFVPEVHLYVFTKKDFIEMLKDKNNNYGKEIVKNRIVLKNAVKYYELLKEAIENGYKG